jgi:hypothetical protein
MANIKLFGNTKIQGKAFFDLSEPEPTYSIEKSVSSVDEGASVTFTLTTTNVADGTEVPYTITGISAADITSGSLTGNFTVNNNLATVTITATADQLTEGAETATLTLDNVADFDSVVVNDTSMAPTYAIARSLSSVNEGSSVTFTLNTTNVANGTVLPYTITGISSNDVTSGSLSGSFTVNNNIATATITMSADQLTEGAETATLTLNNAAASNFVVVNDTSTTPVPLTISGLQLWLDAADSSTLFDATAGGSLVTTDGAAVARWADKSGLGNHATQGTANARPLLKTSVKNGKNILRFDGSNDRLFNLNAVSSLVTDTRTVFIVSKQTNSSSEQCQFDVANNYALTQNNTAGKWYRVTGSSFTSPGRNWWLFSVVDSGLGGTSKGYINGASETNFGIVDKLGSRGNGNFAVGDIGGASGGLPFNGDISEILIYNTALTTTQRQSVETYLNSKWAIY